MSITRKNASTARRHFCGLPTWCLQVPFRFDGIEPVATSSWNKFKSRLPQLERLAGLLDLPLQPISETRWADASERGNRPGSQIIQHCPHCGNEAPKALFSVNAVLDYWPGNRPDFHVRMQNPGKGWADAPSPIFRKAAPPQHWEQLVQDAKNARRDEAAARERKAEEARLAHLAQVEAMKRERERRQQEGEEQKIREQQRKEKEAEDAAQSAKERAAAPKLALLREAASGRSPTRPSGRILSHVQTKIVRLGRVILMGAECRWKNLFSHIRIELWKRCNGFWKQSLHSISEIVADCACRSAFK